VLVSSRLLSVSRFIPLYFPRHCPRSWEGVLPGVRLFFSLILSEKTSPRSAPLPSLGRSSPISLSSKARFSRRTLRRLLLHQKPMNTRPNQIIVSLSPGFFFFGFCNGDPGNDFCTQWIVICQGGILCLFSSGVEKASLPLAVVIPPIVP